jgi:hypothetical protein
VWLPAGEKRFGEKAWWLLQMVGAVPPSRWCTEAETGPAGVIEAAEEEWRGMLAEAWATAAERFRDEDWAQALLESAACPPEKREALVPLLPPAKREALGLKLLNDSGEPLHSGHAALPVIRSCRHAWSDELSWAVLKSFARRIEGGSPQARDWYLTAVLPQLALCVNPALEEKTREIWPAAEKMWQSSASHVQQFNTLLQFRREMLEEIDK